jgi:uncharacterized protein (TIGR02246 family)
MWTNIIIIAAVSFAILQGADAFVASPSRSGTPLGFASTTDLYATGTTFWGTPYVSPPKTITKDEVRALFTKWDTALATLNPRVVANLYSHDPLLLATVSDIPRTDHESIMDYFSTFLKLKPRGKILDGKITTGENWAKDAGIYEFVMGATGATVKARYSFIYVWYVN